MGTLKLNKNRNLTLTNSTGVSVQGWNGALSNLTERQVPAAQRGQNASRRYNLLDFYEVWHILSHSDADTFHCIKTRVI